MTPLIDGDILRYEIGYAAEAGWRMTMEEVGGDVEAPPPWDYVANMLHMRVDNICAMVNATALPVIYLTEGRTFRDKIATSKPYKGTRVAKKPWHHKNLTAYIRSEYDVVQVDGLEADDMMAVDSNSSTIICSRDKDLRQVPGWFYSWELGRQPSYGPLEITREGTLELSDDGKKLSGSGLAFFYAQCLMGDPTDNIPGLPKCGPVGAWKWLVGDAEEYDIFKVGHPLDAVCQAYEDHYGEGFEDRLLEQGRLLWMTRRLNDDGSPVLWELGMED